jgi:flagellar hook-length control protein FliK
MENLLKFSFTASGLQLPAEKSGATAAGLLKGKSADDNKSLGNQFSTTLNQMSRLQKLNVKPGKPTEITTLSRKVEKSPEQPVTDDSQPELSGTPEPVDQELAQFSEKLAEKPDVNCLMENMIASMGLTIAATPGLIQPASTDMLSEHIEASGNEIDTVVSQALPEQTMTQPINLLEKALQNPQTMFISNDLALSEEPSIDNKVEGSVVSPKTPESDAQIILNDIPLDAVTLQSMMFATTQSTPTFSVSSPSGSLASKDSTGTIQPLPATTGGSDTSVRFPFNSNTLASGTNSDDLFQGLLTQTESQSGFSEPLPANGLISNVNSPVTDPLKQPELLTAVQNSTMQDYLMPNSLETANPALNPDESHAPINRVNTSDATLLSASQQGLTEKLTEAFINSLPQPVEINSEKMVETLSTVGVLPQLSNTTKNTASTAPSAISPVIDELDGTPGNKTETGMLGNLQEGHSFVTANPDDLQNEQRVSPESQSDVSGESSMPEFTLTDSPQTLAPSITLNSGESTITATKETTTSNPFPFRSNQIDPADQVIDGATYGIKNGHKELIIRLNPDNLGEVRISLISKGSSQVEARLVASSLESQQLLQSQSELLKNRLESQGITLEKMSVVLVGSTEASSGSGLPDFQHHHRDEASAQGMSQGAGQQNPNSSDSPMFSQQEQFSQQQRAFYNMNKRYASMENQMGNPSVSPPLEETTASRRSNSSGNVNLLV